MPNNVTTRRRVRGVLAATTGIATAIGLSAAGVPSASAGPASTGPSGSAARPPSALHHSTHLPDSAVHPGSVLVAFRSPVALAGSRLRPGGSASEKGQVNQVNQVLAGLHATAVRHLFTNIPAAALGAARTRAMKSTGRYLTDLSQVYQVSFDPSVNDGEAVNRLQSTGLVTSAMPDYRFVQPPRETAPGHAPAATPAAASRATGAANNPAATALPTNYGYATDGQSYHDAAANDVTGAMAELAQRYHQTPGQGQYVTNISLGTIDDTSTVVENGQRYLEQRGFQRIPAYLSHQQCVTEPGGTQSCSVTLNGNGTNTADGQGDLGEVLLDFSVMAPPPAGDPRVPNPQAPNQRGQILGAAYGANYRLINPLQNSTPDFFAAWLGASFLQTPKPSVITASIANALPPGEFPWDMFEAQTMIRDIVTTIVHGQDIFVTIASGDGQTFEGAAGPPDGASGPYDVAPAGSNPPDLDSFNPADPNYTYTWTFEHRAIPDSGANEAGGTTLNDIFNNSPNNTAVSSRQRHAQVTTEERWTGQQNFHSTVGPRDNIAAPADDVLYLAQVEDANGIPVDPVSDEPELVGGTSASCPEIASAAVIVRQLAALTGHPLSAVQTRDLLVDTGRDNVSPTFDLPKYNVGKVLDLTAATDRVLARAHVRGDHAFVRMTVAQRKAVPYNNGYGRGFYSDTPQDAAAGTATIDLSQGLVAPTSFDNETIGQSGDNVNAPITFGADAVYTPPGTRYRWSLSYGGRTVDVPRADFDPSQPYLRLLPAEIFGLLHQPLTSATSRVVTVTARAAGDSIAEKVTFKPLAAATYTHALSPVFDPLATSGRDRSVKVSYDLRGLRGVDGGVLIVSDIDRALPRAFPDRDLNAHGITIPLTHQTGTVDVPLSALQGAGTYGLAVRGTLHGVPQDGTGTTADTTSSWIPLRVAPAVRATPASPKVLATASGFGATAPVWWDVADVEAAGSPNFTVSYDVRAVPGARGAVVEFSAPATDFLGFLFVGNSGAVNVNTFTNPLGDRLDAGNRLGQPGETSHRYLAGHTHGQATFSVGDVGLTTPTAATSCDNTYMVRVFAT
ncbi:MAG: S8 family serine peptidase, partial [Mycobacteriales bacterium]